MRQMNNLFDLINILYFENGNQEVTLSIHQDHPPCQFFIAIYIYAFLGYCIHLIGTNN
jgi:hypothetical protein